ncbi:MAG: outer membrane lipoprotein-sorting protein [Candidatus Aminicenantes bacterium]|nr:outer membrane lipoprotein-sorting protein [Candidatus Aminicenantes bacterium]
MMNKIAKRLIMIVLLLWIVLPPDLFGQDGDELLAKIDRYRMVAGSFNMDVRMQDFEGDVLKEEALFRGFFAGDDRSLLICDSGKNKGMKVLMKGDDMWVNLGGSKRALRITPMQRLMGEASNGDVAKVSFKRDYTGTLLSDDGNLLKLELKAKSAGATYQRVLLYADKKTHQPLKAEFFLLSGKHFKTAYYQEGVLANGREAIARIRIEDKLNPKRYTVMENLNFHSRQFPEKYFNVMYLPQIEVD